MTEIIEVRSRERKYTFPQIFQQGISPYASFLLGEIPDYKRGSLITRRYSRLRLPSHKPSTIQNFEGKLLRILNVNLGSTIQGMAFRDDGGLLAVGLSSGHVRVFDMVRGGCIAKLANSQDVCATSVVFMPTQPDSCHQNLLISSYGSGAIKMWHVKDGGKCCQAFGSKTQVVAIDLNSNASHLAAADANGSISVFDVDTGKRITSLQVSPLEPEKGHSSKIFALQYHRESSHLLASAGWDEALRFWDDRIPHCFRSVFGPYVCSSDGLDIQGNLVLTTSWARAQPIQVWDFRTGNKATLLFDNAALDTRLYSGRWAGPGLALFGGDGYIGAIDTNGAVVGCGRNLIHAVSSLKVFPYDPTPLAVAGLETSLNILQVK